MKDINIRWKSYPHYLPKIRLRRRRAKSNLSQLPNTDGAGSSRVSKDPALKPAADIPIHWRDENNPDRSVVAIREVRLENAAASASASAHEPVDNREIRPRNRATERIYDPRIAPSSRILERSAKSTATQLGNFKPNVVSYRDGQIGKISMQKNRQSLRTISRYSSHSKARRSAAPSIQSVVRSVLSEASSRSPSQRKALAQFTKDLTRYAHKTKQLPTIPNRGLIESPSVTTVSANTIKELAPYRAQFVAAGLAITSKEQKTARRFPKPSLRQLDGRRDTQYDPAKYSRAKTYAVPVAGQKRIKSVLKKKQPSFASGSTGTTVIGFTPPHEKSHARENQPGKAGSLSSDHTVVGFTPPHEKFAVASRSQAIVRTTRQQENRSPAISLQYPSSARSLPTSSNAQTIVSVQSSLERPSSQRTDRSFVREERASPVYVDEVVTVVSQPQKMIQQERYCSTEAGSADTIVVTRPYAKAGQQTRYIESSQPRVTIVQTPPAQQQTIQQINYARPFPTLQDRVLVAKAQIAGDTARQRADVPLSEDAQRVLHLKEDFVQVSPALIEEDTQGRYVPVNNTSAKRATYNTSPLQAREAKEQDYYVDEEYSRARFVQLPAQSIGNGYIVEKLRSPQLILQDPASSQTTQYKTSTTGRQTVYRMPAAEDPFIEGPRTEIRHVQETPPTFAGQYYYTNDSTAQQKLVLVPARAQEIAQPQILVSNQDSSRDFLHVIQEQPPSVQYIAQAVSTPESFRPQGQYTQQELSSSIRYVAAGHTDPQDISTGSPSPRVLYSQTQAFTPSPRTAVKKSLPWLRKVGEPESSARVVRNVEVVMVNSRNEFTKPMAMAGPYPVTSNPQIMDLAREVRTKATFSDDVGMETSISVDNLGTSTNVEVRRTPTPVKELPKPKLRHEVQREVIVLEPNDQGGRLLNAPERRGSRTSPRLKAPAIVNTDRIQIAQNRRVGLRDANNVDDMSILVKTEYPQQEILTNNLQPASSSPRMVLAEDNTATHEESPNTNWPLVNELSTTKLLPFVQRPTMARQINLQETPPQLTYETDTNDVEHVVSPISEMKQVFPAVGKAVLVQKGLAQMNSMRGLIVDDSLDTFNEPPSQATEETVQTPPPNDPPRGRSAWGPVDWTKTATVRDAEEEESEMLGPSQVPSPQIPDLPEEVVLVEELSPEIAEVEAIALTDYEEAIVPEDQSPTQESPSQRTEVQVTTHTNRGFDAIENVQISVATRTFSPQAQIAIPPRNPRRSQVRWLGDRNVKEAPILPISSPLTPPSASGKLYVDHGTQAEASPTPVFRDRGTSAKPVPEVKDRSTSIRQYSAVNTKQGIIRRRTHACTSGSFRCDQCHPSSDFPSPSSFAKRISAPATQIMEELLEDLKQPEAEPETVNTVEDGTELLEDNAAQPSVQASIDEFAKRTPIPDPAKRPSLPHAFEDDIPPIQSPAPKSLEPRTSPDINTSSIPDSAPSSSSRTSHPNLKQPVFSSRTPSLPTDPTDETFAFDTRVFKGWHVATAAASDKEIDAWIEAQTGVSVRRFLVDLSVFDGVDVGVRSLADIRRRARGRGKGRDRV